MTIKLTTQQFIQKSIKIHGDLYDYSKTNYTSSVKKVIIICKIHGEFLQLPLNHYRHKCFKCGYEECNKTNKIKKEKSKNEFEKKANIIHKNIYDYKKSIYENAKTKLIVICKIHGEFLISPNHHLSGKGCVKCGIIRSKNFKIKNYNEYYTKFIELYKEKNDYSLVEWKGSSSYIIVICKKHGNFNILPYEHIKGKDCPKCVNQFSKVSMDWLKYMEIKYLVKIQHANNLGEFIIPGTRYKADGYAKNINTVFEFYGDFWHGNIQLYESKKLHPRCGITFGELYEKTQKRAILIKEKGFNLIEIWENDWKKFIKSIRLLQIRWRLKNLI